MINRIELQVAMAAARAGGEILMKFFGTPLDVQSKGAYNLVSEADLQSEMTISKIIREHFPEHRLQGEESDATGADHDSSECSRDHWIVDPLDGTNNFVHGIPHFAVSIAYYRNARPEIAVVLQPYSRDTYVAVRGQGAWHNENRASTGAEKSLDEMLVGVGFYYDRGRQMRATLGAMEHLFEKNVHGIRRMGTASLDLCMVGTGQFGTYFEFELAPWDFAAGRLFVEEAGGQVTDCLGSELGITNSSVLASNGHVHREMLDIIKPHFQRSRLEPESSKQSQT